jgi:hypothetical protein
MQSKSLQFVNLATNFLVGSVPQVPYYLAADFRFNYFNNCNDSCCLLNTNCTPQCSPLTKGLTSDISSISLPEGIEKSVWTELNVTLLGEKKRIIQIETHFTSPPHLMRSYACPSTSSSEDCDNSARGTVRLENISGAIPLEINMAYSASQAPNTYQKYYYRVIGDVCHTNIQVCVCVCV